MKRRTFVMSGMSPVALAACGGSDDPAASLEDTLEPEALTKIDAAVPEPTTPAARAIDAMRRAVDFMDRKVSVYGGYVWAYMPDLSVTWGEMQANRTMCWIQPPGTPTVGHSLLDAYHATGDERFYRAAARTAKALVRAQHPSGGWNYVHDFAGEDSLRRWYRTVGANGWRLEEFQHYYGNATFDDAGTAVSAQLILRMYLEKGDRHFYQPLQRVIRFITRAQFSGGSADGGWPQRFPPSPRSVSAMPTPHPEQLPAGSTYGMEDGEYTQHVTFNDDVAGENIKFLLMCMRGLGDASLAEPVKRAMECLRRLQQPAPQAGWALQHLAREVNGRPAGAPAGARSYEPRSLTTHTTQTNIQQLFNYFRLTGDRSFLARVPEALAWLETCKLTPQMIAENPLLANRTHPTFVELQTNTPRFVHRYGSNIHNGAYYFSPDHRDTLSHYSAGRNINMANLQATYDQLMALSDAQVADLAARSPLKATSPSALPRYFSIQEVDFPDLFVGATPRVLTVTEADAQRLVDDLGDKNHWLTPLTAVTNPFSGDGPAAANPSLAYRSKHVGDVYDTSPYDPQDPPLIEPYVKKERPLGITTTSFVANMAKLISFVTPKS